MVFTARRIENRIRFNAKQKRELEKEYRAEIGLDKINSAAFDTFASSKAKDFNVFTDTKGADGIVSLFEKLNNPAAPAKDASVQVQAAIVDALKPLPEFTTAQSNYKNAIAHYETLVKQIPVRYKPQDLVGYLKEEQDAAIKAIQAQQKSEIANLTKKFDDPTFQTNLKTTLNPAADTPKADLDKIKTNMLKDLESAHSKQLEELTKSTNKSISDLHTAAAKDKKQFHFIAVMHKYGDPDTKQHINKLAAKNAKGGVTATYGGGSRNIDLTGIKVTDLERFKSLTGKTITPSEDGSSFSVDMSRSWRNLGDIGYYNDKRNNPEADLRIIAEAVRGCGYKKITMSANFDDQKLAMIRGRQSYIAAIESGFKPDQITIKVNGTVMKIREELFKGHEETLDEINKKSPQIVEDLGDEEKAENIAKIRKEQADSRATKKAEEPKKPEEGVVLEPVSAEAEAEEEDEDDALKLM